jgi:hypothetical protein
MFVARQWLSKKKVKGKKLPFPISNAHRLSDFLELDPAT